MAQLYKAMKAEAAALEMGIAKDPIPLFPTSAKVEIQSDDYMARFGGKDWLKMFEQLPQLFLIVVRDKNSHAYERIKHLMDTKYAIHSQVVQSAQLKPCQGDHPNAQYCSNVLLKINAKLGGTTSRAVGHNKSTITGNGRLRAHAQPDYLKSIPINKEAKSKLVMVIGADVSSRFPLQRDILRCPDYVYEHRSHSLHSSR